MKYEFHHIAIACKDINKTAKSFLVFGYESGEVIWDEFQNVNICFLNGNNLPSIELIEGIDDDSPVKNILDKNGVIPYHMCFVTDNMTKAIEDFKHKGFSIISEIVKAPAINDNKIIFMYSSDSGLVEIVEKNNYE